MATNLNGNWKLIFGFLALITTLLAIGGWINETNKSIGILQQSQAITMPMIYQNDKNVALLKQNISFIVEGIKRLEAKDN